MLTGRTMIKGLYRVEDRLLGSCVRVHWAGGDAAPVLSCEIYRALGGRPDVETLPTRGEYLNAYGGFTPDPLEDD